LTSRPRTPNVESTYILTHIIRNINALPIWPGAAHALTPSYSLMSDGRRSADEPGAREGRDSLLERLGPICWFT